MQEECRKLHSSLQAFYGSNRKPSRGERAAFSLTYHRAFGDMPQRKKHSKSAPATVGRQLQRGGKRKQWSNTSMQAAMKAVSDDGMSINKAAVLHGVPKTTLKDRLSGRVVHGTNLGPAKYLDEEEEHALADHLIVSAKAG